KDLTNYKIRKSQLIKQIHIDTLSELYNRAYVEHILIPEFNASRTCSLIFIDIDNLKYINDQFGHTCGDEIIRAIAAIIKESADDSCRCIRLGGDEFCMAIFNSEKHALTIAHKIVDETHNYSKNNLTTTLSIGIVSKSSENESLENLQKRADLALYTSKNNGKNQICLL
ncbi:MAG: GGDEF domain-containing protein, partial [Lentisphaeria bacterium]